jgi:hypothetical protein
MVENMANHQKARKLKRGLGELNQRQKDYMENLAHSLLQIQNTAFMRKSERPESDSTPQKTTRKKQ